MVSWRLHDVKRDPLWDEIVVRFSDYNPFQSDGYGRYWRALGWSSMRLLARDESTGDYVSAALARLRRTSLGIGLMTITGGPLGEPRYWEGLYNGSILKEIDVCALFCRCHPYRRWNESEDSSVRQMGLKRVPVEVNRCLTMKLSIKGDIAQRFSREWRRNLKSASDSHLRMKLASEQDVDEMVAVYKSMEAVKGLGHLWTHRELSTLFVTMHEDIVVVKCVNEKGETISVRGAVMLGERGLDLIAATNEEGRRRSASRPLFVYLVGELKRRGIKTYDMGGIDPVKGEGVYRFKRGTGAKEFRYLGEYDWARPLILRPVVSRVWVLRNRFKVTPIARRVREILRFGAQRRL